MDAGCEDLQLEGGMQELKFSLQTLSQISTWSCPLVHHQCELVSHQLCTGGAMDPQ